MSRCLLVIADEINDIAHRAFDEAISLEQSPEVSDDMSFAAHRIAEMMNGLMIVVEGLRKIEPASAQRGDTERE